MEVKSLCSSVSCNTLPGPAPFGKTNRMSVLALKGTCKIVWSSASTLFSSPARIRAHPVFDETKELNDLSRHCGGVIETARGAIKSSLGVFSTGDVLCARGVMD